MFSKMGTRKRSRDIDYSQSISRSVGWSVISQSGMHAGKQTGK